VINFGRHRQTWPAGANWVATEDVSTGLDRLDLAILDSTQTNVRATAPGLGQAAHLSPSPSHRRQKLLDEAGVIKRYLELLDRDDVGPLVNVLANVKLANHRDATLRGLERAVEACPEVLDMCETPGATY
jgi:Lrp/AsnC family leucine-responsive transcriptional regulator